MDGRPFFHCPCSTRATPYRARLTSRGSSRNLSRRSSSRRPETRRWRNLCRAMLGETVLIRTPVLGASRADCQHHRCADRRLRLAFAFIRRGSNVRSPTLDPRGQADTDFGNAGPSTRGMVGRWGFGQLQHALLEFRQPNTAFGSPATPLALGFEPHGVPMFHAWEAQTPS